MGHDKMRSGADLRGASPLVSFNHVIDPHFVAFSSSLYTINLAKISAVSRKLVQPKRTIKQNVLRGKMSISTSG